MVFETLDIKFPVSAFKEHFQKVVLPLPPIMTSPYFGGWSITSSDGSYKDGWTYEREVAPESANTIEEVREFNKKMNFKGCQAYRTPTEICSPELRGMIEQLNTLGLYPCRVRFTQILPGGDTPLHRDYPKNMYGVRLHIPIITNKECFFECESGKAHLPADGSGYLLKVNQMHRVYNHGPSPRVHIIMDVFDTKNITRFHQFTAEDKAKYKLT